KSEKYGSKVNKAGKPFTWKDEGQEMVQKIRDETRQKSSYIDPTTGKKVETDGFPNPTKGQLEGMAAIEANTNKPGFDTGIRVIYSAPKEAYQGVMASFVLSLFKPFSNEAGNGFKPVTMYSAGFQDYPWEDPKRFAHDFVEKKIVDLYRRRAYFNQPYIGPWSIFSSEELATLYHVPSSTVATPGLPRMQSATSGAPANLPT
ncbi:MAG TPA: hypothetical protein VGN56_01735, partial [Candidatus Paceibacterota bacterium]|nr:hypothetical protein [Candidatus Paceibacterota bacterium]